MAIRELAEHEIETVAGGRYPNKGHNVAKGIAKAMAHAGAKHAAWKAETYR